jgi:hypothetical protein
LINVIRSIIKILSFTGLFLLCPGETLTAGEFGLNIYGLSFHLDRKDSSGKKFNEINPGLGMNYVFQNTSKHIVKMDAGLFKNSGSQLAEYVAMGYAYKLRNSLNVGGEVAFLHGKNYNNGRPSLGIVPMLSFRHETVSFNLLYLPRYKEVNRNSAFGLYATIHLPKNKNRK